MNFVGSLLHADAQPNKKLARGWASERVHRSSSCRVAPHSQWRSVVSSALVPPAGTPRPLDFREPVDLGLASDFRELSDEEIFSLVQDIDREMDMLFSLSIFRILT